MNFFFLRNTFREHRDGSRHRRHAPRAFQHDAGTRVGQLRYMVGIAFHGRKGRKGNRGTCQWIPNEPVLKVTAQ